MSGPDAPIPHAASNQRQRTAPLDELGTRAPIDTMPTGTFDSSNVHSALYDFGERELFVRYLRDGPDAIYQYDDVPAAIWNSLVDAPSKGSYINANIAYRYTYAKLSTGDFPDDGRGLDNDLARRFICDP